MYSSKLLSLKITRNFSIITAVSLSTFKLSLILLNESQNALAKS